MGKKRKFYYQHTKKWFLNRIGKTIYRKPLSCSCKGCQKTDVQITNKQHAIYIYDCHNEMGIKYYDKQNLARMV